MHTTTCKYAHAWIYICMYIYKHKNNWETHLNTCCTYIRITHNALIFSHEGVLHDPAPEASVVVTLALHVACLCVCPAVRHCVCVCVCVSMCINTRSCVCICMTLRCQRVRTYVLVSTCAAIRSYVFAHLCCVYLSTILQYA